MKTILIPCIFLIVSSCALIFNTADFEDTEGKQNIVSKYNDDNIVYKTYRTFVYQIDKDSISKQTSLIHLKVLPGDLFKQTKIKYKYISENSNSTSDSTDFWELTGLIENSSNCWLHPPRSKFYELEFSAFPEIRKAKKKITPKWTSKIYTGNSWGEYKNIIINSSYIHLNDTLIKFKNDLIQCNVISASAKSKFGKVQSEFYWSEKHGFIELNYYFNKETIKLKLIDVIDNSNLPNQNICN